MKQIITILILCTLFNCNGHNKNEIAQTPAKKKEHSLNGKRQNIQTINKNTIRKFDVKKFEKNKGKGKILDHTDMFDYIDDDGFQIVQYGTSFTSKGEEKTYVENLKKEFKPKQFR